MRSWLIALFFLLSSTATSAFAGEIILFEHVGLQGQQLRLQFDVPNLSDGDFNDKVSSIVVRSGRWQVCVDEDYQGQCMVLERGEYRRIDGRFNDRISSVREIRNDGRGRDRRYDHSHGDRDDDRFYGDRAYDNGNYDDREYGRHEYGRQEYGRNAYDGQENGLQAPIVLYEDTNLGGRSIPVNGNINDLESIGFNDTVSSIEIFSGQWQLCRDGNFRGRCRVFGPGRYNLSGDMHDAVSSLRRIR